MGTGRLQSGGGPRQAQGRTAALAPAPVRRTRVHAEVVGDPRHGRAVGGGGLHLGPRSAGLGAGGSTAAGVSPRVGGRRAGIVSDAVRGPVEEGEGGREV